MKPSRQIRYQRKMKAEGRCVLCGDPIDLKSTQHCRVHLNKRSKYNKTYQTNKDLTS